MYVHMILKIHINSYKIIRIYIYTRNPVHTNAYGYISLPIYLHIYESIHRSMDLNLSIHPSACLSIYIIHLNLSCLILSYLVLSI